MGAKNGIGGIGSGSAEGVSEHAVHINALLGDNCDISKRGV